MTTTDEQFPLSLALALDAAARDVAPLDLDGVLDAGRRAVRRRRLAASAGVVAAAALLVLGGWDALRPAHVAVPAAPADPAAPAAPVTARLELPGHVPLGGSEATSFQVSIRRGREADVEYSALDADGRLVSRGSASSTGLGRKATLGWGGDDIVLGIVPDDAVAVDLLENGNVSGHTWDGPKPLPGTGYSAVGFRLYEVPRGTPTLTPLWWRTDGTPASNTEVGSVVTLPALGGRADVWALPTENRLGLRTPTGASTTILAGDERVRTVGVGHFVEDATRGVVSGRRAQAYLIGGRVSAVRGTYAAAAVGQPLEIAYWPELNVTVAFAQAEFPERRGTPATLQDALLTHLAWQDAAGGPASWDATP